MIKKLLVRLINGAGYNITSTKYSPKPLTDQIDVIHLDFDHVISKYLTHKTSESFSFIQIGAFDGVISDPLYKYLQKYNWNGIMLEPQPAPFKKLQEIYKHKNGITVRNAALSDKVGKSTLYTLEGNGLPEWAKGMASFSKENILKHRYLFPAIEENIGETEVETISFDKLFSEYSITTLDLLQIDTEGYDAEIIRMFPYKKIKPKIIHFESKHIPKEELEALLYFLIGYGYKVARDRSEDMMAVLEENY